MPRVQADNYNAKRNFIMNKAAKLFAQSGYPSTRMLDISKACGTSKSMLYHYFPKKEDLLFEILRDHLEELITAIENLIVTHPDNKTNQGELLFSFNELFVQKSAKARTRHIVAMLDVKYLPQKQQHSIRSFERTIISLLGVILQKTNDKVAEEDYQLYSLLLISLLNGMDIWRKPNGKYSSQDMAAKVSSLFLNGFSSTGK